MANADFSWAPERLFQEINPWNFAAKQFGLINIYNESSADHGLELRIVHDVAGYGRQLGRIGEAMDVLLTLVKTKDPQAIDHLDVESKQALQDFEQMRGKIKSAKNIYGSE